MEERKSTLDFFRKTRDRLKSLTSKKSQEIKLPNKIEGELHFPNLKEESKSFLDANTKLENIDFPNLKEEPKIFLDANTKLEELHLDPLEDEEKGKSL